METCGSDVSFTYSNQRSGAGKFVYSGGGSLSCTGSGGNGGCTLAGSGDTSIEATLSTLNVNARLDGYFGVGASSKSYEGTETCPPPDDAPKPYTFYYSAWLATGPSRPMLSRDTKLMRMVNLGGDTYSWNLGAQ